jgi:hypothetical protein
MANKVLPLVDFYRILKDSPAVAKWNPNLAIDWMENIKNNIQNDTQKKRWNESAEKINFTIDFLEKYGKVKHEEYWGHKYAKSRRLTLIQSQHTENK